METVHSIKNTIEKLTNQTATELGATLPLGMLIEKPKNRFGDYASNVAFALAKTLGRAPAELATELAEKLNAIGAPEFSKIETAGGYINFWLAPEYLQEQLFDIAGQKDYGQSVANGKSVIVEYSDPNIAKRMHVGHLRSTILGDSLANLYAAGGWRVTRWNYLGDWGTQFGKLIAAYRLWGDKASVEKDPITTLQNLYVRFHDEMKTNLALEEQGRIEFKKLENNDPENIKLWQWFKAESLKEFKKIYDQFAMRFDVDISESFYKDQLAPLVAELREKKLAIDSQGSVIIPLEQTNLPVALIQKADGASLYLTRDIANLRYRLEQYHPDQILYVVGNEQTLHFAQLAAIAKLLGWNPNQFAHIKFGLILGEDKKKLATRSGRAIPLEELIDRAIKLAGEIVEQKNPNLTSEEKLTVARVVGIGALKYHVLKEHRNTGIVFDWQKMLDFSGDSGPYLQYTYARMRSILAKQSAPTDLRTTNLSRLETAEELALIKQLIEFPETLERSREQYATNFLTLYLYELASLTNRFYEKTPILKDSDSERLIVRLVLVETVSRVLKTGLNILGIQTLEKI